MSVSAQASKSRHVGMIACMEHSPWGGCEWLWTETAFELLNRGVKVSIVTKEWEETPEIHQKLKAAGATFITFSPDREAHWLIRRVMKWGIQFSRTRAKSVEWLKSRCPDIVLISQASNWDGVDWMNRCLESGIPYATLSHSASEYFWPNESQLRKMREGVNGAIHHYYVSDANKQLSEKQIAAPISPASIVRNPVRVSRTKIIEWPVILEEVRLAFPARYELHDKGQYLLLEVLAMEKWRSRALSISLYGAGPHQKIIEELVHFYRLTSVKIVGYEKDVEKIWAAHHGLILTSRVEGLPISIVEAMLCGRVCLVTDAGGNKELIEEGVTGWVAPFYSVASIDEMLEKMWAKRKLLSEMGVEAREQVLKKIPERPESEFADDLMRMSGK